MRVNVLKIWWEKLPFTVKTGKKYSNDRINTRAKFWVFYIHSSRDTEIPPNASSLDHIEWIGCVFPIFVKLVTPREFL